MLRHKHVVIGKENHPGSSFRAAGKLNPLPDHVLPLGILGMCLACKHDLDGALSINEDVEEPRRIMQEKVGALVCRKAAGESQSQTIVIEYQFGLRQIFRRCSPTC